VPNLELCGQLRDATCHILTSTSRRFSQIGVRLAGTFEFAQGYHQPTSGTLDTNRCRIEDWRSTRARPESAQRERPCSAETDHGMHYGMLSKWSPMLPSTIREPAWRDLWLAGIRARSYRSLNRWTGLPIDDGVSGTLKYHAVQGCGTSARYKVSGEDDKNDRSPGYH
jgi:hypothetical protein